MNSVDITFVLDEDKIDYASLPHENFQGILYIDASTSKTLLGVSEDVFVLRISKVKHKNSCHIKVDEREPSYFDVYQQDKLIHEDVRVDWESLMFVRNVFGNDFHISVVK